MSGVLDFALELIDSKWLRNTRNDGISVFLGFQFCFFFRKQFIGIQPSRSLTAKLNLWMVSQNRIGTSVFQPAFQPTKV